MIRDLRCGLRERDSGGRGWKKGRARHGANVRVEDSRWGTRGQLVGGRVEGQVVER